MPNLNVEVLSRAMFVKCNDMHLVRGAPWRWGGGTLRVQALYVASVIRAIAALHDLVRNKVAMRELDAEEEAKAAEVKEKTAGAAVSAAGAAGGAGAAPGASSSGGGGGGGGGGGSSSGGGGSTGDGHK